MGFAHEVNRVLILVLLCASVAAGQTFKVDAGASSLLDADGATLTMYGEKTTSFVGVGVYQGQPVWEFGREFNLLGFDCFAGDKSLSLVAGSAGVSTSFRGVALTRKRKHSELTAFVGGIGAFYSAPFFQAESVRNFGSGLLLRDDLAHGLHSDSVLVIQGKQKSALETMSWIFRPITLEGTAGLLQNQPYTSASANLSLQHFGANVSRTDLISTTERATVTSASASGGWGALDVHGSVVTSQTTGTEITASANRGAAYGGRVHLGSLAVGADFYKSAFASVALQSVQLKIAPRFSVSEYISESGKNVSFAPGGTYTGKNFGVSVSWQESYYAFAGNRSPWQKSLSLSFTFNVDDAAMTVSTLTDQTARLRWSAYGSRYETRQTSATVAKGIGKHVVRIKAVDGQGNALEGVAVAIGSSLCVSNSFGECIQRTRKTKALPLKVEPEQFAVPGKWRVVSAPATVEPDGDVATVVVERVIE
jgi:hypothetical protein